MPTTGKILGVNVKSNRGFTLIELMVVVAIIAILAAIALPSYRSYVRKSHRTDAQSAMQAIALKEESFRADNPGYTANWPNVGGDPNSQSSLSTFFTFTLTTAAATSTTPATYTLTATAVGDQANDKANGVSCTPLVITVSTAAGSAGQVQKTPTECWSR